MAFGTPQALWLFFLIPFFVILHFSSFSDMGRFQRGFSLLLRLVLISAIILALADTRLIQRSDKLAVFFLWDGSRSMGQGSSDEMTAFINNATLTADDERDVAGIIAFGRSAFVETGLTNELMINNQISSDIQPDFTNLASAIDLALASLPEDRGARIVVLSDGNENLGDAVMSARAAANRGVEIDTVPLGKPSAGEVVAGRLILPRRVDENEMFDVRAVIESESETDAVVEIFENDQLIGSQQVHLLAGKNVFTFPQQQTEGGFYGYRIQVSAVGDVENANNSAVDYTIVQGAPRVCYVSGDPNEQPYLVNALVREGVQADFRDLTGLPTSIIDMAPYDVIMFSDVGAELLMPETMQAYQSYVRDLGRGFAMIGGENSFGPGGYYRTPIEELLPVDLDLTKKEYMPSIAICLVIDKSGSMSMLVQGGVQKIDVAKEAARYVVDLLDQSDQIGIVAFDYIGQWVVPLQQLQNKSEIIRLIGGMRADGGTDVYTGMVEAYNALRGTDAKIKHMIVLSDGITGPGDFDNLIRLMNAEGMTLTTISIGADANRQLMEHLAQISNGSHYFTDDIRRVPRIFTKETFLATNRALIEEPFNAVPNNLSPTTEGINWNTAPLLFGYVATNLKSLATEPLETQNADPLLAHWQYGLGRSLAFTSDTKARWAAGWLNWDGYEQMWTQSARWLVGGTMASNLLPNIYFRAGKAYISVDAIDSSGEMITDAMIMARVIIPPKSDATELDLFQVAPGRYEVSVDATEIGSYLVNIYQQDSDGNTVDQVSTGFSVSYPPEYEKSGPDMFLLAQLSDITGGQVGVPAADVFRHTNQPISRYFDLWYYLLLGAICILPFDIAVRRLSLTGESIEYVRDKMKAVVIGILTQHKAERQAPTHIDSLKKVREQYRLTTKDEESALSEPDVRERLKKILSQRESEKQDSRTASRPSGTTPSGPSESSTKSGETKYTDDGSSLNRLLDKKRSLWEETKDKKPEDKK